MVVVVVVVVVACMWITRPQKPIAEALPIAPGLLISYSGLAGEPSTDRPLRRA